MSVTDRTIQRYCHNGKLRALRVDPDTRQPTDRDNYLFLIDPSSIPERIAQLREKQEFVSPTVVATSHDLTRPDVKGRDTSRSVESAAAVSDDGNQTREGANEIAKLKEQVMSLEIDKRVRDGLLDQMKNDRKELLSQLQGHVETMTKQGREIGRLETRLELSAPEPQIIEEEPALVNDPAQPVMRWENGGGDNGENYNSRYGV